MGAGYFYNRVHSPDPIVSAILAQETQGIEVYYNVAILPSTELTFDFQWTDAAFSQVDDSLLLAFRLNVSF